MLVPRPPVNGPHQPGTHAPDHGVPLVRVVDDEASIRGLFTRMRDVLGAEVVTCETAKELFESLDDGQAGCIVLDLVLPDLTGIEVLNELARRGCQLPVVFMSGMARVSEAVAALKLGSIDFIEKPFTLEQMTAAIHRAIGIDLDRRRSADDEAQLLDRFRHLTPREVEVMERIVRGAANKEVAAELGLSPKTVEVHRANIMRKTRAGSLAELVRMHVAAHVQEPSGAAP